MRRPSAVLAAGVAGLICLASWGCGSSGGRPAAGSTTGATPVSVAGDASRGSSSSALVAPSARPRVKPTRTPPPTTYGDRPVRVETAAHARLVGLRVRPPEAGGVERIVFTFADTKVLPSYDIGYVDVVRPTPDDDPIAVEGKAYLRVNFAFTDPNHAGRLAVAPDLSPEQPLVEQTVLVRNLGGSMSFAVGLRQHAAFRAVETASPTRLTIEIRPSR